MPKQFQGEEKEISTLTTDLNEIVQKPGRWATYVGNFKWTMKTEEYPGGAQWKGQGKLIVRNEGTTMRFEMQLPEVKKGFVTTRKKGSVNFDKKAFTARYNDDLLYVVIQ